jgi:tetratricopeptide (TPR) repeat protein
MIRARLTVEYATGFKRDEAAVRSRRVLFSTILVIVLISGVFAPWSEAGRAGDVRKEAFSLINQGVTAYKNGDYAIAVERLRQASSMALNNFRAHFYLGLALIGDRRYRDALEALSIALDLDPDHLQSLVAVGDAYLKLGDISEAQAAYYSALKFRPEYAAALDGLARVYEAQAENDQAIEFFLRAISSNRGFAPAYTHLGDLYLRVNKFEEAVELLEEAVQVRPDFAAGLNRLSLAYGRLGLINEAIATIQKALEIEPHNAEHPATLGQLALEQGSLSAAESAFRKSLALDEAQPHGLYGLAEVARRRGHYELSLERVDAALSDPRLDAILAGRFKTYRAEVVEEKESFERLESLVDTGEAESDHYSELALIYADRRMWTRASELQAQVDPTPEQRERLAFMLFRANRFREAHQIYVDLLAETGTATAAVNDGVTLAMLGDDGAAVEMYRRALDIDPANRTATLFLANALLRQGHHDEAVEAYKTFLQGAERGEWAERVRRILAQIAPDALPPAPKPLETPLAAPGVADDPPEGDAP